MNWNKLKKQIREDDKQRLLKKRDHKAQRKSLKKNAPTGGNSSLATSALASKKLSHTSASS